MGYGQGRLQNIPKPETLFYQKKAVKIDFIIFQSTNTAKLKYSYPTLLLPPLLL